MYHVIFLLRELTARHRVQHEVAIGSKLSRHSIITSGLSDFIEVQAVATQTDAPVDAKFPYLVVLAPAVAPRRNRPPGWIWGLLGGAEAGGQQWRLAPLGSQAFQLRARGFHLNIY